MPVEGPLKLLLKKAFGEAVATHFVDIYIGIMRSNEVKLWVIEHMSEVHSDTI